jgi:hypothetical protein
MPFSPDVQNVIVFPLQVNVPLPNGQNATIQVYDDGTNPEGWGDQILQDLTDYLQAWPGRAVGGDASGTKYVTQLYSMLPTNPDVPPEQ